MRWALLAGVLTGCVDEYDVDLYASLPAIPTACETLGAAALSVTVHPTDEPAFELTAAPCTDALGGQQIAGFYVEIQRLTAGYHRLEATILDTAGDPLGTIALPFSAARSLVIPFARADLPGWPTTTIASTITGCDPDGPVIGVDLTATPALDPGPATTAHLDCAMAAPIMMTVPAGPVTLSAIGTGADGKPCWTGMLDATASPMAALTIPLTRSCP